jgi:[acyl-carrier-protein] S-malonyltransferase
MLKPWLDETTKKIVANWSLNLNLDLEHLGTTANADEIKDTANAQPLIVASGLLAAAALGLTKFSVVAGHSVGELTASAVSGVLSPADALELVRQRGISMAKAASQVETGMAAVLGGDRAEVLSTIQNLELVPANENGTGQIVAAGSLKQIDKLVENPPTGARVRVLAVAGAFHTNYMQSAVSQVAGFVEKLNIHEPNSKLLSNKDGAIVANGKDAIERIVNQIANPVRWDLCMDSLIQLGVTGAIEFPPAGTLIGLLKRASAGIETLALKSPEDLTAAKEFAIKHGGA